MPECWRCNQARGVFGTQLTLGGRDAVCGYCFRDMFRRCPTCAKPNTDTSCRAYT